MNAFDLHQAAFDAACECQEETVGYIKQYADGALNVYVSGKVAQEILRCRNTFAASKQGSDNYYRLLEEPLSAIEI